MNVIDFIIGRWYPSNPSSMRGIYFPAWGRLGLATRVWLWPVGSDQMWHEQQFQMCLRGLAQPLSLLHSAVQRRGFWEAASPEWGNTGARLNPKLQPGARPSWASRDPQCRSAVSRKFKFKFAGVSFGGYSAFLKRNLTKTGRNSLRLLAQLYQILSLISYLFPILFCLMK